MFGFKSRKIKRANEVELLAIKCEQIGDIHQALSLYEKSIKIKETYSNTYNYGRVLHTNKDYEKSIKYLKKSAEINLAADTFLELGNSYYMINKIDDAIKAWKASIAVDSNYIKGYRCLWVAYLDKNQNKKAMEYAKKASRLGLQEATIWISQQ